MKFFKIIFILSFSLALFSACKKDDEIQTYEYLFLSADSTQITDTSIVVKWNQTTSSEFSHYQIHRSKIHGFQPGATSFFEDIYVRNQTSDTITPLLANTTYYFKIKLFKQDNSFTESSEISARTISP